MTDAKTLHRRAMATCDLADAAKRDGREVEASHLFMEAYRLEMEAYRCAESEEDKVILLRSSNAIAQSVDIEQLRALLHRLEALKHLVAIQCQSGNWDYGPYMHGMANGMIMAVATLEEKDPVFLDAPERWLGEESS